MQENFELTNLEEDEGTASLDSDDNSEIPPSDIVAFNELRSCADLFRMKTKDQLDLQPDFQRDIVWPPLAKTRFIDSLMKGLPIPSMCFAFDYKKKTYQVIDGLQRISTIVEFLDPETDWTLSNDDDIDRRLRGKSVFNLRNEDLFDSIENLSIPVTILRCDLSKPSHTEYIFTIFHRLNTGGTKLNNQEIRNCIFQGDFNNLLSTLDSYPDWRALNKMKPNALYRYTKQEIILRLFALTENHQAYGGRLSKFLNEYMRKNRHPNEEMIEKKKDLFKRTVTYVFHKVFGGMAPEKVSISILEAVLVGAASNIDNLEGENHQTATARLDALRNREEFSVEKLKEGLSGKPRVIERIDAAIEIFS